MSIALPGFQSIAVAQQANGSASANLPQVSTGVGVEYATIGGVQLPIQVLRPDSAILSGGQAASNTQIGSGNTTTIRQLGQGNRAAVEAIGNLNTALIEQKNGNNNVGLATLTGNGLTLNLLQDGSSNRAEVGVHGPTSGGSLTVQQTGDGNVATGSWPGGRNVVISQSGNSGSVDVTQVGVPKDVTVRVWTR